MIRANEEAGCSSGPGEGQAAGGGSLLLRGGTYFTASESARADILVRGGRISAIAEAIDASPGITVLDAGGLEIYPGGVDVHTHFELPFMGTTTADDFESGTMAAACGGTTTIVDFVIPAKGRSVLEGIETWRRKAAGKCAIDYGFHLALVDFDEQVAADIPEVVEQGITSFKCFLAYKGALMIDDAQLLGVLDLARRCGALVSVHAENGDVLSHITQRLVARGMTGPQYHPQAHPDVAEGEATHRAIVLAGMAGAPLYVVHMSCNLALDEVKAARARGQLVLAETCPQYLLLSDELYRREGFEGAKWVMSPPLRGSENQDPLWAGLRDGFVQCVATDHCSFNYAGQKEMGKHSFTAIPNGIPGVEDRMGLLYAHGVGKGRLSRNQFAAVTATNPARAFGLHPRKGTIAVGADADFALIDPRRRGRISRETTHHRVDYSAFEGFELEGVVAVVVSRGRVVFRDGAFLGEKAWGRWVPRKRFDAAAWGFPPRP